MTTNSDILPFFWDLASLDEEKRIKAAEQLLTRLTEVQQQHRNDIEDVIWKDLLKGEQTEEILEKLCAKDVLYTLKRLIRGLSSSRKAARQGFALAFTELLRILEFIHIKLLIDMIMKATEINSQMNGQEERDMLFGRIFGFLSIVRSGLLCHQLATMEENVMKMVNELLTYGKSKPFLREAVHHVFCEMIPQLLACKKQGQTVLQHMSAKILENDIQTPDALLYALTLERHGIDKVYEYTPSLKKPYLQESNLKKLATILRESSTQGQSDLYSVWHPQLHSVWEYILPQLYEKDAVNDLPFHRCWKTLVDDNLFHHTSSHERKFWGFILVQRAMQYLTVDYLPMVFTRNMMNTLMNHLASEDRYLYHCAMTTVSAMIAAGQQDQQKRIVILLSLIGEQGNAMFDRITGTNTVALLLEDMDADGLVRYVSHLLKRFAQHQKSALSETDAEARQRIIAGYRQTSLDQIGAVARMPNARHSDAVLSLIEDALMMYGYLDPQEIAPKEAVERIGGPATPELATTTRVLCRQKLMAMLVNTDQMNHTKEQRKSLEQAPRIVNAAERFGKLLEGEFYAFADDIDDDALSIVESALGMLKKIDKQVKKIPLDSESVEHKSLLQKFRAFQVLFAHFAFESLSDPAEYGPLVEDMKICYDKLFSTKKSKKKVDTDEPDPIAVLLGGLLSLASKPPAALRNIAKQVFVAFCKDLTRDTFFIVLKALEDTPEPVREEKEENEMEVDEDEDDEEDEDEETDAMSVDDSEEMSDDTDASDVEYHPENDADTKDIVLSEEQVRKALGPAAYNANDEKNDDDDDLESLNDEQMMAFDRVLETMFYERKLLRQEKHRMTQAAISFKLCVLDFIEIFLRRQPTSPLVFESILPIMNVMSQHPQIESRSISVLTHRIGKLSEPVVNPNIDTLIDVAKRIFQKMHKNTNAEFQSLCNKLLAQLVRSVLHDRNFEALDQLMELYNAALERFSRENTQITEKTFAEIIHRYPLAGWRLSDKIASLIESGDIIKAFRSARLIDLLTLLSQVTAKGNAEHEQAFKNAIPALVKAFLAEIDRMIAKNVTGAQYKNILRCLHGLIRRGSLFITDKSSLNQIWQGDMLAEKLIALTKPEANTAPMAVINILGLLGKDTTVVKRPKEHKRGNVKKDGEQGTVDAHHKPQAADTQSESTTSSVDKLAKKTTKVSLSEQSTEDDAKENIPNSTKRKRGKEEKKAKKKKSKKSKV